MPRPSPSAVLTVPPAAAGPASPAAQLGPWLLLAALTLGAGCAEAEPAKDSAVPAEVADDEPERPEADEDCAELELKLVGPEAPVVGDSITVILRCDGAPLIGTSVLRVTPLENADIQDNVVTFTRPGPVNVRLQVGSRAADVDLVVGG